jgi:hypothetical protein
MNTHLEAISFKNLVKDINAKWGHTYEPITEQPIEDILKSIESMNKGTK